MFTIQNIAQAKPEAYNRVNEELQNLAAHQLHNAYDSIHQAIQLIWLLPETPKREELREKVYSISDDFFKMLNEELVAYREESK